MADYIEREPLLKAFKEKCCQDCPGGYSRQQCHSWCDAATEIALIENAPAVDLMSQLWHDAKSDPPGKDDGDCFIVHTEKGDLVMEAEYSHDPEKIESGRCWTAGWGSVIHVTDWMPMPEPPKKENKK